MHLILLAWMYVVVLMSLAEAFGSQGTVLGALITLLLYGVLPVGLLAYVLGTPGRKRRLREQAEAAQASPAQAGSALEPDAGREPSAGAEDAGIATVRKEP